MDLSLALAWVIAAVAVVALAQLWWGRLRIPALRDVPPIGSRAPRVSIIVAARNEERHVESAARAFLALDYPDLELLVVDDRSTDATPAILARIAAEDARLRVVRVDSLPAGWLGKNHALHHGASLASGTLLLFCDADVVLRPDALARAVRLLELRGADHLAVAPDLVVPTWPLSIVVHYFMMWYSTLL